MKAVYLVMLLGMTISCRNLAAQISGRELFSPFLESNDPRFFYSLACQRLLNKTISDANSTLSLSGYDYSSMPGVVVDDLGFIPSYRILRPTPRQLDYRDQRFYISRRVSQAEISDVNALARETVISGYKGSIQPEIMKIVKDAEGELDLSNYSFGVVRRKTDNKIVGVLRVTDGYVRDGKLFILALEILRRRGLFRAEDEVKINSRFGIHVDGHMDVPVREIGQYYLDPSLAPADMVTARHLLLSWLVIAHLDRAPNVLNLVHISTPRHEAAYRRFYGFNDLIVKKSDGAITEKILSTTSESLVNYLNHLP
jgi:hypothetical protein